MPSDLTPADLAAIRDRVSEDLRTTIVPLTGWVRERRDRVALLAEVDRLQRIIDGYDRTPAEQRAAVAEAERDQLRDAVQRVDALAARYYREREFIAAHAIRTALAGDGGGDQPEKVDLVAALRQSLEAARARRLAGGDQT